MRKAQLQLVIEGRDGRESPYARDDEFQLDDRTRALGKAGVAAAREALRQAMLSQRADDAKAA